MFTGLSRAVSCQQWSKLWLVWHSEALRYYRYDSSHSSKAVSVQGFWLVWYFWSLSIIDQLLVSGLNECNVELRLVYRPARHFLDRKSRTFLKALLLNLSRSGLLWLTPRTMLQFSHIKKFSRLSSLSDVASSAVWAPWSLPGAFRKLFLNSFGHQKKPRRLGRGQSHGSMHLLAWIANFRSDANSSLLSF